MTFMLLQASTHCCIVYARKAIVSPTSFAFLPALQSYSLLLYDRSVGGHELSIVGVAASGEMEVEVPVTVGAGATTTLEMPADDVCTELVAVAVADTKETWSVLFVLSVA